MKSSTSRSLNWAELRFSIVGPLLARGPEERESLQAEFARLAKRHYRHPGGEGSVRFATSTIERWYYQALTAEDPLTALARKTRKDQGQSRSVSAALTRELEQQFRAYAAWSYKLHYDNLEALVEEKPALGPLPSYTTIRRLMKKRGWIRKKGGKRRYGREQEVAPRQDREVRSYEVSYAHGLWHLDFHRGGLRLVDAKGEWRHPWALCVIDDYSRLVCHLQWFWNETAECLIHGLTQACYKRGLPRSLMTDNGSAMIAEETVNGLLRLGISHEKTLPYSPYQNAKQEAFWAQLEGRLIAMLSRTPLDLEGLNRVTQAWVEQEYNRKRHSELATSPLKRFLAGRDVSRPAPGSEVMGYVFTRRQTRQQRKSDGTLVIQGVRFEIPTQFRCLSTLKVRYRAWDLTHAYLVDPQSDERIAVIRPLDKTRNSDGKRRLLCSQEPEQASPDEERPLPPLLSKLLADYAVSGLPAGYLPLEGKQEDATDEKL